jgi:uncharacterized repeat protein (TIGR03803 family)
MKKRSAFWRGAAVFGAALLGGAVLFSASASAKLKTLHSFCKYFDGFCRDGGYATGPLVMDSAGNLFGTARDGVNRGGVAYGLVHEAAKSKLKYKVLRNFCADLDCADGSNPAPLIIDTTGNLYGVTSDGGTHAAGVFFELVRSDSGTGWKYTVLYNLCAGREGGCADGGRPFTQLTYAGAENGQPYDGVSPLYGGGVYGGKYFQGTVFSLQRVNGGWRAKSIYDFCKDPACPDGWFPTSLLPDGAGNLIGITGYGGGGQYGFGVAFKLTPSSLHPKWDQSVLHRFCSQASCADGGRPYGIAIDSAGNIFGTTSEGGSGCASNAGCGLIYEITSGGSESTIYQFCSQRKCRDGYAPSGPLLIGSDGSLIGTTGFGGSFNRGTLFKWSAGTFQRLYAFCQKANCTDGAYPGGGLLKDLSGSLFGTTSYGGANPGPYGDGGGTVFRLTR